MTYADFCEQVISFSRAGGEFLVPSDFDLVTDDGHLVTSVRLDPLRRAVVLETSPSAPRMADH